MNVFVLSTGRCGSTTFIQACRHASNYTSAHESRWGLLGPARLGYPDNHIEADNRLSWFLGRLDQAFGKDAAYVHLKRDRIETARSFVRRYDRGIINAYRQALLVRDAGRDHAMDVALDYCDTVNGNIEAFLKDKPRSMTILLEQARETFPHFWDLIGAEGDLSAALREWETRHNASPQLNEPTRYDHAVGRAAREFRRIARSLCGR
jgi:hypothetical protein